MQTGNRAFEILRLAAILGIAVISASPSDAQYTSPGIAETTEAIPEKESFDNSINNARWNAGPIRLSPWIGLRDVSFVSTQSQASTETEEDFTLTVGGGLRAYLPTGKFIWAAQALPEYVWWDEDEAKRGLNGRFGLGLFGYFNRLQLEVSQRREEVQNYFSAEVQELTTNRVDTSRFAVEVEVARRLEVFGNASLRSFTNEEDDRLLFSQLDRDEEVFTVGLRYTTPKGLSIGLGLEDSTTELEDGGRNLSNSGTSELVEVVYSGGQFSLRLALAFRDLEADDGSDFGVFDDTTGRLEALWNPSSRTSLLTYARRSQVLSVDLQNAFVLAERQGVRFEYSRDSSRIGVYAEVGEDEFDRINASAGGRIDDTTALGAELQFEVNDLFRVSLNALYTDYDSNLDSFDRDITSFGFAIQLGSLADRLSLGRSGGDW
ncbi:MAG: hypothetical protein AAF657_00940 [Acidobacteriota bacterium]